jgi:DNA mismatch endonuclease (patch repair protein)
MQAIKSTKPEMAVRRMLQVAGYRYRLHVRDLLGKPALAFTGRRAAIFAHGASRLRPGRTHAEVE